MDGAMIETMVPTSWETLQLPSGRVVEVPKATPSFVRSEGMVWNGKPLVDFEGTPLVAELLVWRLFERDGWSGGWMTSSKSYRTEMFSESKTTYPLPEPQRRLLEKIYARLGNEKGRFDLYCWKGDDVAFVEVKHRGSDWIKDPQKAWIEAALEVGVTLESLLIVEWTDD